MDERLDARASPDGLPRVRVTPKASVARIGVGDGIVRVFIAASPAKGKANKAAAALVARALDVPKSAVEVVRGQISRNKVLRIG